MEERSELMPAPSARARTVLVVDDSAQMRKVVSAVVKRAGHYPLEAADGIQALDMARGWEPALVILDMVMPGLDGMETLRQLREIPAMENIPVVLLTQVQDAERIREAGKYGVRDYLSKPAKTDRLLEKIRKYLG
ncbi:MAG: response regulator [Gemmatimonadota bacterium]